MAKSPDEVFAGMPESTTPTGRKPGLAALANKGRSGLVQADWHPNPDTRPPLNQDRRAISVPFTGVGRGISRLLTGNRRTRSARSRDTNTSLCKQGVGGSSPPSSTCENDLGEPPLATEQMVTRPRLSARFGCLSRPELAPAGRVMASRRPTGRL